MRVCPHPDLSFILFNLPHILHDQRWQPELRPTAPEAPSASLVLLIALLKNVFPQQQNRPDLPARFTVLATTGCLGTLSGLDSPCIVVGLYRDHMAAIFVDLLFHCSGLTLLLPLLLVFLYSSLSKPLPGSLSLAAIK